MKLLGLELSDSPLTQLQPGQQLLIIGTIIALATLAIAHNGILQPLAQQQARLESELQTAIQKAALIQEMETVRQNVEQARQKLPLRSDAPQLLQKIAALAAEQNIVVNSVIPQATETVGRYWQHNLRIEASGSYNDVIGFCRALQSSSLAFTVTQMELSSDQAAGRGTRNAPEIDAAASLTLQATVSTFLRES